MAFAPDEVIVLGNWLVTTAVRTAFDCARLLPLVEAVVVVDAMVHGGLITIDALLEFGRAHPGIRFVRQIPRVVELADAGSESPMESRTRLVLVLGGLPKPRTQVEVRAPDGQFVARLDMAYPEAKLAIEYDGAWHWQQRRQDDRRRDALRALGWTVLVFSADDIYRHPGAVVAAVQAALRNAA
jgi:very-short-patch-repair endonuclease